MEVDPQIGDFAHDVLIEGEKITAAERNLDAS
jgi:hypothetical protein